MPKPAPLPHMRGRISARRQRVRDLIDLPTTEKRADTQGRLICAGKHIIAENGVGGSSVGLITAYAGYSRGAFYSNFSDMNHFVVEVATEAWNTALVAVHKGLTAALRAALPEEIDEPAIDTPTPGTTMSTPELTATTRTLIEAERTALAGLDINERLNVFARALLAAIPRDREFHLLWASLANFTVRDPAASRELRAVATQFRLGMADYVEQTLNVLGLAPALAPIDIVDLLIAVGARSTRGRLTGEDSAGAELIDRLLPTLLPLIAHPAVD